MIDQVELVHRHRYLVEAQEAQQIGMPPRLLAEPLGGIDDQQGGVGAGRAAHHVGEELAVAGRIDDDDVSPGQTQPDLRGVDGDGLVPLGLERVEGEGPLDGDAAALAHRPQLLRLAGWQRADLMQQAADQGRLAVVDMADHHQLQKRHRPARDPLTCILVCADARKHPRSRDP